MPDTTTNSLDELIANALEEDIDDGDITTEATVDKNVPGFGAIACKQDLIVSGLDVVRNVFATIDPALAWKPGKHDGDRCKKGDILATVEGSAATILTAERTALNFLQHLSGIATLTGEFVKAVQGTGVKIVDTRKTIPGLRELEKKAVVHGGGTNHRMGLYDRYLIKNNHIDIVGSLTRAVEMAVAHRNEYVIIEVEVRNDAELDEAIAIEEVDVIMLDNWPLKKLDEAIVKARGHCMLELSGGITLKNIKDYARAGIDFISVGALTHSTPAADINMRIATE